MTQIATQEDEFTREKWLSEARWTAYLSNGMTVIQDDGRPGLETESAWLRLREYVIEHKVRIISLFISFRSERPIPLPENADGYFFRRALAAYLNSQVTIGFFLVGYLQGKTIKYRKYRVPEMLLVEQGERDPEDEELVGPSLICNPILT